MISKDINATDLLDYYTQLYGAQARAHTAGYMLVHDEVKTLLDECSSYTEFGVFQGTTLAIALLKQIPKIRAYDNKLAPYNKVKHYFTQHAIQHKLDYVVTEADTLRCSIDPVDLLYIDTWHVADHLRKELHLHGNKAQKYIVFHDTFKPTDELKLVIRKFVDDNPHWKIHTECDQSVGFMTIARTHK